MKHAIIALLIIAGLDYGMEQHFDRMGDSTNRKAVVGFSKKAVSKSPAYQVDELNALVARVPMTGNPVSKSQRQAEALADVYGLTEKDLNEPIRIFGKE